MFRSMKWKKVWQIENNEDEDEIFHIPRGLAVDEKKSLVMVDGSRKVQKFIFSKRRIDVIVQDSIGSKSILPQYVAIHEKKYFITDFQSQDVFVCDREGKLLKFFETKMLKDPLGIAINDVTSVVYVANKGKNTISIFTTSGDHVKSFAQNNCPEFKLVNPYGVGVSPRGNVIVSDRSQHRIHVYDSGGNFLYKFGSEGSDPGQLRNPEGIAIDKVNNIYVCDNGNNRVQIFDETGRFISCLNGDTALVEPKDIAVDDFRDRVFVSAYNTVNVFEKEQDIH